MIEDDDKSIPSVQPRRSFAHITRSSMSKMSIMHAVMLNAVLNSPKTEAVPEPQKIAPLNRKQRRAKEKAERKAAKHNQLQQIKDPT